MQNARESEVGRDLWVGALRRVTIIQACDHQDVALENREVERLYSIEMALTKKN